jgi:hypothetical protein
VLKFAAIVIAVLAAFASFRPSRGVAIPIFSHQYDVSCSKCHSVIPRLNEFGAAFMAEGYRIPGVKPGGAFPVSVKVNGVLSSENQGEGPGGAGLPKAIIDEVEAFTAGGIGSRASYLVEQYVVDGGMPGLTRDAWVTDRLNPWDAKIGLSLQAGSFTLPLPVDPETFRETAHHYGVFDQAVGTNTFNFFDPKIGARLQVGNPLKGLTAHFFAGQGHERRSGLPATGTDVMVTLQHTMGPLALTAFHYAGTRPGSGGSGTFDTFHRTGYGVVWNQWGRFSVENVLMNGNDGDCGIGGACQSSGGFTQLRYAFPPRLFALGRYEGTMDPVNGFSRNVVLLLGYGPTPNSRITIEDVIAHSPQTTHTMNVQFTIAY